MTPQTRYTKSGDLNIAYQVIGDGPFDLVFVPGLISNLELAWDEPHWAAFLEQLASFSRLILFDRRGVGLSDRVTGVPTLEERTDDVRVVLDAADSERAALFGSGDAGAMFALYAAAHPDRTAALVLCGTQPCWRRADDYPWGFDDAETRRWVEEPEQRFTDPEYVRENVLRVAPSIEHDSELLAWYGRTWRLSGASPGAVAAFRRMNVEIDIRAILPTIRVPTLVVQRRDVRFVPREVGAYVAAKIPGAEYVELPGADYLPWFGDTSSVVGAVERFLIGVWEDRPWEDAESNRVLTTVLFTDIVNSTAKAADLGDQAWRELLTRHHAVVRRQLARFRGAEIDTAGDGFFATFDGPARAIRCAGAIVSSSRDLGVELRVGLHTGECETIEGKVGGIAVHLGARVAASAEPGEVLVSSTVKDLVAGSGLAFSDRGVHALRGIPGEWHLYAADT
ncbi:MAG: adenylate/guanylate cyclase domain-containing protein [Gaiellaceae bacterium]